MSNFVFSQPWMTQSQIDSLERELRDIQKTLRCESRQMPSNPPTRPVVIAQIMPDAKPKGGFEFL